MASLPPPPSDTSDSLPTMDPELVLDTLDAFNANAAGRYHAGVAVPKGVASADTSSGEQPREDETRPRQQQMGRPEFDPIEFLNRHYHTEQQLVSAIPGLRAAISARLSDLDDDLSTTLRHQAALAPSLARDVVHARHAVSGLAQRVLRVRDRAKKSEEAVLEITRDMKRLDYAKRHLQRTITALRRLHMLLHAAEQLRMAAMVTEQQPIPRYRAAAHLVDATRELLGHFEGYFASVPKMRQVRDAIGVIKGQLWEGIVNLFREVGFPPTSSEDNNSGGDGRPQGDASLIMGGATEEFRPAMPSSSMVQTTLADACLVIEALGPKSQERFITDFVKDHLREYDELYNPMGATTTTTTTKKKKKIMDGNGGGGSSGPTPSFKKDNDDTTSTSTNNNSSNWSLDTVENRFAWYRLKLRDIQLKFANVFPSHWNIHYRLTSAFLEVTSRHLKFILKKHQMNSNAAVVANVNKAPSSGVVVDVSALKFGSMSVSTHGGGVAGDTDKSDIEEKKVAALLKALQKTIHFEKEMSAWLSRDFGIVFDSSSGGDGDATGKKGEEKKELDVGDIGRGADGNDDLEFDDRGRAVPAKSAEGIRIKYERRKRMGGGVDHGPAPPSSSPTVGSVPPLAGIASTIFDEHMLSYVALEERSMEEQLKAAATDNTVDTRGERPVFVSSTNLFIYMKNSLTRCTALTKEKTFFLLQRAFQKKLREYAKMLEKKLPLPIGSGVAKLALVTGVGATGGVGSGSSSSTAQAGNSVVYRIPPGEEVTVCHVIDTCEYCADTVEALEDLIRDKIGDKYKDKIDMNEEQGAFQDVTAKSLRVLVSGLEQRLDVALKEISRTNWASFDMVGEESGYVRTTHVTVQLFVVQVRELIPSSYFRSFCDKFAMSFASTYYRTLIGLKKISEAGTQQLLLDVYSVKTLLLKLPVMEADKKSAVGGVASSRQHHHGNATLSGGSTIAPAMYTKMVNKEFRKLEVMLKLVGSPREMLVEMFRAQWDCSMDTAAMASDFAMIMTLKGIPRTDHAAMLETLGVDAIEGGTDTSAITVNIQALQDRGSDVAAKVNADLNQMRQRVDDFRKAFR